MSTLHYNQKSYSIYKDDEGSEIKKLTNSLNTVSLEEYNEELLNTQITANNSYIKGKKSILNNKQYISEGIEVYEDNEEDSEDDYYISHNKCIENETNNNDHLATSCDNEIDSEDKVDNYYDNDELDEDQDTDPYNYGDFYDQGGDYFYYNNGDDYGIDEGFNIYYYRGYLIDYEDYDNSF